MVTLTLLALIPITALLYFLLAPPKRKLPTSIPAPPAIPLLGHALLFFNSNFLQVFTDCLNKYGGVFKIYIGTMEPILVFANHKSVEHVLGSTKHLDKSVDYRFFHSWLGTGLLTSNGTKWKKHRRIITPTFHFKVLEDFVEVFESTGNILIEKLKGEVGKKSFNIVPFFGLFALDAICETAMGVSINAQQHPSSEYVTSVKEMCRIVTERGMSLIKQNDFLYKFTSDYAKERKALKVLHGFTTSVIKERKQEVVNKTKTDEDANNVLGIKKRKAFLDLLLEISQKEEDPLTDEELREEVDTFMFAGHDTTSTALGFACYCLADNPDIQKAAYEEQIAIFGTDNKNKVTFQDLQNMQYLEMVIKESLRLYPSAPLYSREFAEDVKYEGETIQRGAEVAIFAYGIHHDPNVYPNPEKFDPERFAGASDRSPYAYIPFSAGSRNCMGQKFAMLEMKATMSMLLRNFEIIPATPKHELDLTIEVVLMSKTGVHVALKAR